MGRPILSQGYYKAQAAQQEAALRDALASADLSPSSLKREPPRSPSASPPPLHFHHPSSSSHSPPSAGECTWVDERFLDPNSSEARRIALQARTQNLSSLARRIACTFGHRILDEATDFVEAVVGETIVLTAYARDGGILASASREIEADYSSDGEELDDEEDDEDEEEEEENMPETVISRPITPEEPVTPSSAVFHALTLPLSLPPPHRRTGHVGSTSTPRAPVSFAPPPTSRRGLGQGWAEAASAY